jgi:oligopeptide/dipeptide ABC transporter ATP-binding protein
MTVDQADARPDAVPRADTAGDGDTDAMLEVDHVSKVFDLGRGRLFAPRQHLRAVDDVSFSVARGETLAVVGESGCGKTTTARMVALLDTPTTGRIRIGGRDLRSLRGSDFRRERRRIQMVFQDPTSSLDPRMRVRDSVTEPLAVTGVPRTERDRRVDQLLERVGLDRRVGYENPVALSGGQRQRVGIARALALEPDVIVADEPTSALDLSIRAQVINLLRSVQRELDIALVFISHDLGTVRYLADRVAVMYLGRIVEEAPTGRLFGNPLHPYTRALLSAVPVPDPAVERGRQWKVPEGDVPNPVDPPTGCAFRTRCPHATDECATRPDTIEHAPAHTVACHYAARWVAATPAT